MSKKKEKKPKVGDTVFLRGDKQGIQMLLTRIRKEGVIEYGFCSWTTSNFEEEELVHKNHEDEFLLLNLTTLAPPFLGGISLG